jgi:hypothetical protein
MVDSAPVKRSRVRDEEKWEPVFHPHPLKISGIYHVHDFGWVQPKIIMICGQWKEQVLLHSFPGTHFPDTHFLANAATGGILGRQPGAPRTIMGALKVKF